MLNIAIVDDEQSSIDGLKNYLSQFCKTNEMELRVDAFSSGSKFLWDYKPVYDIIFMDIEMEGINGMETAERLRKKDSETILIFVTRMAQYAVRGYQVEALDFLVKPLSYYSFELVMRKAMRHLQRREPQNVVLNTGDAVRIIPSTKICYVEVLDHYLTYHTATEKITVKGTLTDAQKGLDAKRFFRCSRCYLVNLSHVTVINKTGIKVGNAEIEISRSKRKELLQAVNEFFGGNI